MTIAIPLDTPVTIPLPGPEETTVAIAGALLLHIPPDTVLLSTVVAPVHTFVLPVITDGNAFTVIVVEVLHPLDKL